MIYRAHSILLLATAVCLCLVSPAPVMSLGFDGVGGAPCSGTHAFTARFSAKGAQYSASGTCTSLGSLGIARAFPYTVKGAYANNIAEEVVEIPAPAIHEPSRPHGRWHTKYSCPADPWLTYDKPSYAGEGQLLKCQIVQRSDQSPTEIGRPRPNVEGLTVGELLDRWRKDKPMSSTFLMPAERAALVAQRDRDLKAEAEAIAKAEQERRTRQKLTGGLQQPAAFWAALTPTVLAPTRGQRFYNRTAVPIRLGAPMLATGQVELSGKPIYSAVNVTGYMIKIERKDTSGKWIAQTTIPVSAAQAHAANGYTGFGNGAPPAGITSPGAWRLSAQVSAPNQSGWTDWVEFHVMTPPTSTNITKPGVGFGKK